MSIDKKTIKKLESILGKKNLTTDSEDLICYSYDATGKEYLPDAVAFPGSVEEVSAIMKLATAEGFPVIPRGAGSGFAGGSLPVEGGLILAMKRLNRILEIDEDNMTATVEPGVVTGKFQEEAEKVGLFYPPDPSSLKFCTIGGNIAMGSGGPRAVKYGVTKDYVLGLELVLPTGEKIKTGTNTVKGVVGYDITGLMVGSEGTLGIVTKVILKLIPKPVAITTLNVEFPDSFLAGNAVSKIMASGCIPATLELIDKSALACIKDRLSENLSDDVGAILIIEVDGSTEISVNKESEKIEGICNECGSMGIKKTNDRKEAEKLWETRRAISPSLFKLGTKKINEDIAVPRSKVPILLEKLASIADKYKITMANFGHAGDGNIHVNIMINKGNKVDEEKAEGAVREVFRAALDLSGTISGEHGVGLSKQPYIRMELSHREIELMKGIKKVFDPKNILNPGKIFP